MVENPELVGFDLHFSNTLFQACEVLVGITKATLESMDDVDKVEEESFRLIFS